MMQIAHRIFIEFHRMLLDFQALSVTLLIPCQLNEFSHPSNSLFIMRNR
jgi:hypothetical protein